MELQEVLKEKGVETLEELEAKLIRQGQDAAKQEAAEAEEKLRKQIKDLEEIKAKQGDNLGSAKKELDEAKQKLLEMEKMKENLQEKKPDNASDSAREKGEDQWGQENRVREAALTDDQWSKLDDALKAMDAETRKLASATEEGRAAFMDQILGSAAPAQETFRRPVEKKKLSVREQIEASLKQLNPNVPASVRSSGSGFSDRPATEKTTQPNRALMNTGSIRDMMKARKGE